MSKRIHYRIKDDIDLSTELPKYGFTYTGNYNRGDSWTKEMESIDKIKPTNGIMVNGDWADRRLFFKFPYRKTTDDLNILDFIPDLIEAGLVEEIKEEKA